MQTCSSQPVESMTVQQSYPQANRIMVRCLARIGAIAGLMAVTLPALPAMALFGDVFGNPNVDVGDYRRCSATLTRLKLSAEEASAACAHAFKPDDLATCVNQVSNSGTITVADALGACSRVRRPVDMASCVVDIRKSLSDAAAADVLENCRRSLLPVRYSSCVVGVTRSVKLAAGQALGTCINASDFPSELDPTFLPYTVTPGATESPTSPTAPQAEPQTTPQTTPSPSPQTTP